MKNVFHEAWAAVIAHPWRSALTVASFAILMMLAAVPDAMALGKAQISYEENLHNGGAVIIIKASDGSLDANTCLAIAEASNVRATGALYSVKTVNILNSPGTSYRIAAVSANFLRVIDPNIVTTAGLIIGRDLRAETSLRTGSQLLFDDGSRGFIGGELANSARSSTMGRWILEVVPLQTTAQECWIDAEPASLELLKQSIPSFFPQEDSLDVSSPVRSELGFIRQQVDERSTAWGWTLGTLLNFAACLFLLWNKRHELALYLVTGFPPSTVVAMATIELILLIYTGIIIAILGSLAICAGLGLKTGLSEAAIYIDILLMACGTLAGCNIAGWIALPRNAARTVRARD